MKQQRILEQRANSQFGNMLKVYFFSLFDTKDPLFFQFNSSSVDPLGVSMVQHFTDKVQLAVGVKRDTVMPC